jgi:hypothetical protein
MASRSHRVEFFSLATNSTKVETALFGEAISTSIGQTARGAGGSVMQGGTSQM